MSELIERVAREIAKELYDRFVMGGWEPQDVHGWLSAVLGELSAKLEGAKSECGISSNMQDVSDWEWWFFKTAQERLQCIKDLRSAPPRKEGGDTRWEDWRKQLLDAWAKDHRATMTALLEGGPAAPPRKAEETTNG